MSRWVISILLVCCAVACKPTVRRAAKAKITISAEPATAEVWVNERYVGNVDEIKGGLRVPLGKHRIELRHDDYHSHFAVINAESVKLYKIKVSLARRY